MSVEFAEVIVTFVVGPYAPATGLNVGVPTVPKELIINLFATSRELATWISSDFVASETQHLCWEETRSPCAKTPKFAIFGLETLT
jgi:hypothetical protein